ncbi:MAG: hypothetical protein JWP91_437 [Fibrobacteres bacterium]|nr:hypothetical protein [Fibrobacterota bacterium]
MLSGPIRSCFRAVPQAFPILLLLILAGLSPEGRAQADRFFRPTEGFTRAKDLPEDFTGQVRSVQLDIKDAFEGSTAHSDGEQWLFDMGNKLHIESLNGTIRRRLLFREGDTITKNLLLETEKTLRQEEFLADAIIEVMKWQDGTVHVKVTTYDQWTTVPGFSLQRLGGEWIYWVGPVESNLLGTGQRLGFFLGHDQFRDTRWLDYNNNALLPQRLHLASHAAWLSDGYSVLFSLSKPLESRTSRYAFSASLSAVELSENIYFDANRLDQLPDSLAEAKSGIPHILRQFGSVATHDLDLSVTRSFGYHTKFNVSPTFNRRDRYNHGNELFNRGETSILRLIPLEGSALHIDERLDYLVGVSLSMYQYDYKTVENFNNLKWSETLETGWRLSTKVARNQEWMGARNDDFLLSHAAVYNNAWWDAVFFNTNASLRYFVAPDGDFDDGYASAGSEIQWKPVWITSTYLAASWANLFASEQSQQLLLGEDNGLNGYPNLYYAGQARFLLEAEQRLFPRFEIGTVVPAFALFLNAGNTFPGYSDFDPDKLHYALGFGLRLGASKSVQKVVNHVNLSWPVGEEHLSGPVFSIRAKKSL